MKLLNPRVATDLEHGKPLRIDLGSGSRPRAGFYALDHLELEGVDIVADLNRPLELLPDNCAEHVFSSHALEHVHDLLQLLAEIHRITRPGGLIELVVPHFSNPYFYSDPTHVRFFGLYSFFYFCEDTDQPRRKVPNFYAPMRFRVDSVRFNLMKESFFDNALRALIQPLINRGIGWLDWYERRLCRILPVSSIRYVLRPLKGTVDRAAT